MLGELDRVGERVGCDIEAGMVGHVLVERPACRDVEELQPAAHAEQRRRGLHRQVDERQFEVIALRLPGDRFGIDRRSVPGGLDVSAARQQNAIEVAVEQARIGVERQKDREPTGAQHAARIVGVVPVAVEPLEGLGHADDRRRRLPATGEPDQWSSTLGHDASVCSRNQSTSA